MIVVGRTANRAQPLIAGLRDLNPIIFHVAEEPTTDLVLQGCARARGESCDVVIGIGGGSVIDAAKAMAALVTNERDLFDYLEVIGRGNALERPGIPCIAVPTTAGTGAEVTRNSVLASKAHRVKASLRSPFLLPRFAVVDPELSYDLPADLSASTGLDALTQLIEPYVSTRANPVTDALCVEGMRRAARSLRRVCENGRDANAREDMAVASLFGGLALANAGLGAVHGFAAPIGGMFPAPHGAVCAALLPFVMEANVRALRARQPQSVTLRRYDAVARILTGQAQAQADAGALWVRQLCADLAVSPLRKYGLTTVDLPGLVELGAKASSMRANPIVLTPVELHEILSGALEREG